MNFLEKVRADFAITKYAITGFEFSVDDSSRFDPFCDEALLDAGFVIDKDQPTSDEFFFLTPEYEQYLQKLIDTGKEHPSNKDGLVWTNAEVIETEVVDAKDSHLLLPDSQNKHD